MYSCIWHCRHLLTSPCISGCSSTVCRYWRPDATSLRILWRSIHVRTGPTFFTTQNKLHISTHTSCCAKGVGYNINGICNMMHHEELYIRKFVICHAGHIHQSVTVHGTCTISLSTLNIPLLLVYQNKKALLSQRWPRNAHYMWTPWKISGVPGYAHGYFSRNC